MQIISTVSEMQNCAMALKAQGKTIGLVPTMGFLHEGHLSLIRRIRPEVDVVVVSVFVNPTQFGPDEDLEKYPRDFKADQQGLEAEQTDIVFYPHADDMYLDGHSVNLSEEQLSATLCGASRPVHFGGVLTVVAKLFNIVRPDQAVFGEKDAQQIRLIRRMVRDLNFPVTIIGAPIVRESDGLAMSSRNANLTPDERKQAVCLKRGLDRALAAFESGETDAEQLTSLVHSSVAEATLAKVDYIELVDNESLSAVETVESPALLAIAVHFSKARLIDNCVLRPAVRSL